MPLPRFHRPQILHTPASRAALLRRIGASLGKCYESLVAEPLPARLQELARRLQDDGTDRDAGQKRRSGRFSA